MFFRNQIRIFNQQVRHYNIIRFTNSHEYIKKQDGFYTLGITKLSSRKTTPIVYLETLVNEGDVIKKNQPLILLESPFTSNTIRSPFDCIIKRFNKEIMFEPYIINDDPLNSGWICDFFVQKPLFYNDNNLMNEDEYNKFIKNL